MDLREFLEKEKRRGRFVEVGGKAKSLMLKFKSDDIELNFGVFRSNCDFENFMIAHVTQQIGRTEIGESYLMRLASLFDGGSVRKGDDKGRWTVKKADRFLTIGEVLAVQDKWLEIIQDDRSVTESPGETKLDAENVH
jgi:hypothetical protein